MLKTSMRYFLAVVQHGSIRAASEALRINQSAISRQIQSLEQEYDTTLFERHARGTKLTQSGELLFTSVRDIGFAAERTRSEINALQGLKRGHIRIHTIELMLHSIIPSVMEKFRDRFPGVDFEIVLASSDVVASAVRNGESDFGMTFATPAAPGVSTVFRMPSRLAAFMRPDHKLAGGGTLAVGNLTTWPIGVANRPTGTRQLFDNACRARGVEITPKLETNSVQLLHHFAMMEDAVAVTCDLAFLSSVRGGQLVSRLLDDADLTTGHVELLAMTGRKPTVAAEKFLLFLGREFDRAHAGQGSAFKLAHMTNFAPSSDDVTSSPHDPDCA